MTEVLPLVDAARSWRQCCCSAWRSHAGIAATPLVAQASC